MAVVGPWGIGDSRRWLVVTRNPRTVSLNLVVVHETTAMSRAPLRRSLGFALIISKAERCFIAAKLAAAPGDSGAAGANQGAGQLLDFACFRAFWLSFNRAAAADRPRSTA